MAGRWRVETRPTKSRKPYDARARTLTFTLATLALGLSVATAAEPKWKVHPINDQSPFEAAGAFDVDKDGKLDVVSGESWYKGPDWAKHKVRDVAKVGTYYNCFMSQPMDVNADGKMDYVTCSYFGQNVGWVENPGDPDKEWTYHEIDKPGNSEAGVLVDLTGDGVPEILPNSVNAVAWYELEKAGPEPKWIKHDFGNAAAGHGVGTGDVNGDGKVDIAHPQGLVRGPFQPLDRDLDLARRLEGPGRHRHPDPRQGRRRRRPRRPRLRHGP